MIAYMPPSENTLLSHKYPNRYMRKSWFIVVCVRNSLSESLFPGDLEDSKPSQHCKKGSQGMAPAIMNCRGGGL